MKRNLVIAAVAVVVVILMLIPIFRVLSRGTDWRVKQLYGSATSIDCLTQPQAVDAFILDPDSGIATAPEGPPSADRPTVIGRYAAALGGKSTSDGDKPATVHVLADATTVAELSTVLLDPDTYDWMRTKSEPFRPTLGLRFTRDASRLELAICFESNMLVTYRMGRFTGVEDIDDARPAFVAIAKHLFPGDPRFASLRDQR